jgi:GMP synthase (glutamine-hydrolysing)
MRRIDAHEQFLNGTTEMDGETVGPLCQMVDPEIKRRIIGDVFYHLINQAIAETGLDFNTTFIAQGTLRPDLIESGNRDISQTAHKIKTHHNDVPLIRQQREKGLIIEPNRDWHKDEVRQVGRLLGLPEPLVARQPFPGPGLGVRILCTQAPYLTEDYATLNQSLQAMAQTASAQGLLLPVKSVGVQGDGRSYSYLAALNADWPTLPWQTIKELARDIPNRIHAINRVALLLNRKPLPEVWHTITPTTMTPPVVDLLRSLDHQVTSGFDQAGLLGRISQLLTVLVPVDTTRQGGHSVAIRAVVTADYMTARPADLGREIPLDFLQKLADQLAAHPGIDCVFYDVTSKPPATVEWE